MYKYLLCWRYLRTRYIALVSIISVTLGVATMIVVNCVMAGFSAEMQTRLHGLLSDVVLESHSVSGFPDADGHMQMIHRIAGNDVAGMTPTVAVPGMLSFKVVNETVIKHVNVIGVDATTHASVSDFGRFLQHPANRDSLSFELRDSGYDVQDHEAGDNARPRPQMALAGWKHRRAWAAQQKSRPTHAPQSSDPFLNDALAPPSVAASFDPASDTRTGLIGGIALFSYREATGHDKFLVLPGEDVQVTVPTAGSKPKGTSGNFTVVDVYESKMSEYDSSFIFVPLEKLQTMRGMVDPKSGKRLVNAIQIKLKPGVDLEAFRDKLRAQFDPRRYGVYTWRDKQGPLLAAVEMETTILNILLFLIIAVAGFGILAIFFMIVVEKTKDIGILKSLGASGRGVMGIFLGYGISLGAVGAGAGMVIGLLFVQYINEIASLISRLTGRPVFDPSVYYFHEIPTIVSAFTISWIVAGAILIATLASVLPARRAAALHPVEALRYE